MGVLLGEADAEEAVAAAQVYQLSRRLELRKISYELNSGLESAEHRPSRDPVDALSIIVMLVLLSLDGGTFLQGGLQIDQLFPGLQTELQIAGKVWFALYQERSHIGRGQVEAIDSVEGADGDEHVQKLFGHSGMSIKLFGDLFGGLRLFEQVEDSEFEGSEKDLARLKAGDQVPKASALVLQGRIHLRQPLFADFFRRHALFTTRSAKRSISSSWTSISSPASPALKISSSSGIDAATFSSPRNSSMAALLSGFTLLRTK
ncbi:MAG: hypothetical protein A4E51_00621 [Methanosaeta sp. PtaU1.Bin055]|nr:MAG: hypothetical protein A4E51_00621 [Methanosaeta sp. PtaU1.Bin055]